MVVATKVRSVPLSAFSAMSSLADSVLLRPMRQLPLLVLLLGLGAFLPERLHAQSAIQLSGVVITTDSLPQFIPRAYLRLRSRNTGTLADDEGFFSLAVWSGDTVEVSHLGFQREKLYVPDTLTQKKYLVQIFLKRDTTMLQEVTLYPWPSPDRLISHLLNMQVETTQMDIAQRNLAIQSLRERAATMGSDAVAIQRAAIRMQESAMYNRGRFYGADGGMALLGALSNPFAWAQFFESLKKKK